MRHVIIKPPYFVIKCDVGYWLEEGGCTSKQGRAERFETRELAQADLERWCHPSDTTARVVKIVRTR